MNDLRSILKNHEDTVAQRNTVEFDVASIMHKSRRGRTLSAARSGAIAASVASVIGLGTWWGLAALADENVPPVMSPDPLPSLTPTPFEEPVIVTLPGAPQSGPWAQYFVDAEYTDLESPSGERWLTEPIYVDEPEWARTEYGNNWYLVGARDGSAILIEDFEWMLQYFEVDQNGDPRFLSAAAPGAPFDDANEIPSSAVIDSSVTYESLTWTRTLDTPLGVVGTPEEYVSWELPPGTELTFVRSEPVGDLYEVRRSMPDHNRVWTENDTGMPPNPPFGAFDLDYAVLRPYGGWIVYRVERPSSPAEMTNALDTVCMDRWSGSMTLVTGVGEEYWTPGTDSLLLPTADNPVLGWWHDWHVARHEAGTAWGPVHEIGLLTREEFRTLPAMAAAPGIEDDSWIVWVNQAVSQRDFC